MWLNESEQELHIGLQNIASNLRWSAVELLRIAEQLRQAGNEVDAQVALRLRETLVDDEVRLAGYAQEVKGRAISRTTKAH